MLIDFFFELKAARIPVTVREFLILLEALKAHVIGGGLDDFYHLSRTCLVKDESHYDKFDRAFAAYFDGVAAPSDDVVAQIPEDWLRRQAELLLSDEEKALIASLGGWEELIKALRERLAEQQGRHQGGAKWIGTAGTSPFGAYGYNPEGVRIGQEGSRHRRAVKVWDAREFRSLDDSVELGTRNIKVALKRLRRFAREGSPDQLDLEDTISATAKNAGYLDLKMVAERHNAVKVLLFLDVGGSMDDHVKICEQLFSAARAEFKRLEYFYFHNCVYESVWRDRRDSSAEAPSAGAGIGALGEAFKRDAESPYAISAAPALRFDSGSPRRGSAERASTSEVIHRYGRDYKLIFVGDATMSPYEIAAPGGSIEHLNQEAGAVWMRRLVDSYPASIWLNPQPEGDWTYYDSLRMMRQLMGGRMFPLTLEGLTQGMRELGKRG